MAYKSPLLIYHQHNQPYKRWLTERELLALGTLAAGLGAALTAMFYVTGRTKLAASFGIAGALTGAIVGAVKVLGGED